MSHSVNTHQNFAEAAWRARDRLGDLAPKVLVETPLAPARHGDFHCECCGLNSSETALFGFLRGLVFCQMCIGMYKVGGSIVQFIDDLIFCMGEGRHGGRG